MLANKRKHSCVNDLILKSCKGKGTVVFDSDQRQLGRQAVSGITEILKVNKL